MNTWSWYRPLLRWLLLALLPVLLSSCSSSTSGRDLPGVTPTGPVDVVKVRGTASVTVEARELQRLVQVEVIPAHAIVPMGETLLFSAVGYDQKGREVEGLRFKWRMENQAAGSISPNGVFRTGHVTGAFQDATSVSASQETSSGLIQVEGKATVSVTRSLSAHAIDRVLVFPDEIEVERGGVVRLSALAVDRDDVVVPGARFQWAMEDHQAGSVDLQGLFTAGQQEGVFPRAIGVTAQGEQDQGPVTAFVDVRVTKGPQVPQLTAVTVLPQAVALLPGDTFTFSALPLDQQGNRLTNVETDWSLAVPQVGRLDSKGRLLVEGPPGTYSEAVRARVTARQGSESVSLTAAVTITILEPPDRGLPGEGKLSQISLYPQEVALAPGESARLSIVGLDNGGQVVQNVEVQWSVPEEVGEITRRGKLTAGPRPGAFADAVHVQVRQETEDGPILREATATVVITGRLAQVTVTPQEITIDPGGKVQFSFAAYDTNGARLFDVDFAWNVTDERAGTIDSTGLLTAGKTPGHYPNVVQVEVTQRSPPP